MSDNQIRYAFDDVRYLLPLWRPLETRLTELGRHDWLREEMEQFRQKIVPGPSAAEKWRKIRGAGSLDRGRLAIVRELHAWRERRAAEVNRPARTVLRDDLIVEIARCSPRSAADVQSLRGIAKQEAAAIFAAVNRARLLPQGQWPEMAERDNDPPQVALLAGILTAVLTDLCLRTEVAMSLAATAADVKALVRSQRGEGSADDSPLLSGWRSRHLLPELLAVLHGRRAVRVADPGGTAPLDYVETPILE